MPASERRHTLLVARDERAVPRVAAETADEERRDPRPWWALELVSRLEAIERQQRWQTAVLVAAAPVLAGLGWIIANVAGG